MSVTESVLIDTGTERWVKFTFHNQDRPEDEIPNPNWINMVHVRSIRRSHGGICTTIWFSDGHSILVNELPEHFINV